MTSRLIQGRLGVILAGGLGTRLRSEFNGPKSLAPVGQRPFLDYLLKFLQAAGVNQVVLCLGYKGIQIEERYGTGASLGIRIQYSRESQPLGTAGALKAAQPYVTLEDFLVLNGDSLFNTDLVDLFEFHRKHRALATLALARISLPTSRYGSVRIDERGIIMEFADKRMSNESGETLISSGCYVMNRAIFDEIPFRQPASLENDVFPGLVGKRFYGLASSDYFIDIGIPEDFRKAQTELPQRFGL